ncbi:MAG: hypothetical protein KAU16_07955 [Methanophagales archaeon]|nr:hypothetical protein [Methanophagales archaeon]
MRKLIEEAKRIHAQAIGELERGEKLNKKLGLSDRLGARDTHLHRQCFYKGECEADAIKEDLGKVKRYVEDIEKIVVEINER